MKNKIKSIVYSASTLALVAPVMVMAQVKSGTGGTGTFQKPQTGLPEASLFNIINNIMKWLLIVVGIAGVIGFAIAGILYLTAAGDDAQIKKAKTAMTASITGVIVALAGMVALNAAQGLLGAQNKF